MATGYLALICLTLGQGASDVSYYNYRSHGIPVTFPTGRRQETERVLLYVSTDQGRNWQLNETIPSSKDQFAFHATKDGIYWLSVAMVNKQGKQEPDDKTILSSPPQLKMVIDTVKPVVRSITAQRQGDEVFVNWDVQEDNPSRDGVKLEYQVKDAGGSVWVPVASNSIQAGQARFRPGNAATLLLRLTVRDLAGNESNAFAEAAGSIAPAGFNNPAGATAIGPKTDPPVATLPGALIVPSPVEQPKQVNPFIGGGVMEPAPVAKAPTPIPAPIKTPVPPPTGFGSGQGTAIGSPPPPAGFNPPQPAVQAPPPPQPVREQPTGPISRLAADSRSAASSGAADGDGQAGHRSVSHSSPTRRPLPPLTYVNTHQVTLEYELKRLGPSGIGDVELWLTKDDGATWEQYARDKDAQATPLTTRQKRTFDFRDLVSDQPFADGIYGLTLVVKNRAGIGREPRAGDVPEIRIEIDKAPPLAQLYEPIPDPQRPDHVLIMWNAVDKNLTPTPISLEYSADREQWNPIKLDLDNKGRYPGKDRTGDYSWKVPANFPEQVYLRLRVRDKAGNEGVAITDRPYYVDLIEPEGALVGVQAAPKR